MGKKIVYKKNNWISTEYIANEFDKYVKRELLISVNNATKVLDKEMQNWRCLLVRLSC